MDGALVVVLVLLWAVVLLPGAIRSRRTSAHVTVGGFERAMDVLRNRPPGRELLVPRDAGRIVDARERQEVFGRLEVRHDDLALAYEPSVAEERPEPGARSPRAQRRRELIARRRQTFGRMVGSTLVLILAAVVFDGPVWTVAGLSLATTVAYAALLRRWKLQRDEASAVVRTIQTTERRREATHVDLAHAVGETPMFGGGVQVATRPDDPWQPQAGVRIRRWDD